MKSMKATRQQLQLVIAVILIGGTVGLIGGYVVTQGFEDALVVDIVKQGITLLVMATGAALYLLGLGSRRVTGDEPQKDSTG